MTPLLRVRLPPALAPRALPCAPPQTVSHSVICAQAGVTFQASKKVAVLFNPYNPLDAVYIESQPQRR